MKKIDLKTLKFEAKFHGNGCINYDSFEQQSILRSLGLCYTELIKEKEGNSENDSENDEEENAKLRNAENIQFAKKEFHEDEKGAGFKFKVSSNTLRHSMYRKEMPRLTPQITKFPKVKYRALANPAFLERGYFFGESNNTLIKKSPLTIADAIEDTNIWHKKSYVEVGSKSGEKDKTSLFYKENVGEKDYKSIGFIDLQELQFLCLDDTYARKAIDIDQKENETHFLEALSEQLPGFNETPHLYIIPTALCQGYFGEKGILFNPDSVDYMVKDILKKILNVIIRKPGAYLSCTGLWISYFDDDKDFVTEEITLENIDDYYFNVIPNYQLAPEDIIENYMGKIVQKDKKPSTKKKKSQKDKADTTNSELNQKE